MKEGQGRCGVVRGTSRRGGRYSERKAGKQLMLTQGQVCGSCTSAGAAAGRAPLHTLHIALRTTTASLSHTCRARRQALVRQQRHTCRTPAGGGTTPRLPGLGAPVVQARRPSCPAAMAPMRHWSPASLYQPVADLHP